MSLPSVHPLSFRHRFGKRYARLFDTDFFLAHDPHGDSFLAPEVNKPPVNITRQKEAFELRLPLPGYHRQDISVLVGNGVLTVKGEREDDVAGESGYILREHSTDYFERTFRLAPITDEGNITARFKDGILYLHLPHKENGTTQTSPADNRKVSIWIERGLRRFTAIPAKVYHSLPGHFKSSGSNRWLQRGLTNPWKELPIRDSWPGNSVSL